MDVMSNNLYLVTREKKKGRIAALLEVILTFHAVDNIEIFKMRTTMMKPITLFVIKYIDE